jgi:hypothetical protein
MISKMSVFEPDKQAWFRKALSYQLVVYLCHLRSSTLAAFMLPWIGNINAES